MSGTISVRRNVLLSAVIATALAGCGGGAPVGSPAAGGSPSDTGQQPTASLRSVPASSPTTAPAAAIEACSLLSDDDIEQAAGHAVETRRVSTLTSVFPSVCDWELDGDASLTVSVKPSGGREYYELYFEPFIGQDLGLEEAVTGIGDKAAYGEGSIMAVKGDALVDVHYFEQPPRTAEAEERVKLVQIVLSRLP